MLKTDVNYALFPQCPIRNVLSRIGDKWSMLVLFTLERHGTMRFNSLKLYIPDISKKMLSTALKVLEADGLVSRRVYAEVPPRVEYSLTELAETFRAIQQIAQNEHLPFVADEQECGLHRTWRQGFFIWHKASSPNGYFLLPTALYCAYFTNDRCSLIVSV